MSIAPSAQRFVGDTACRLQHLLPKKIDLD